jgi:hypothetical protein
MAPHLLPHCNPFSDNNKVRKAVNEILFSARSFRLADRMDKGIKQPPSASGEVD